MRQQNGGVRHRADQRKFNMSEGEKLRLRVSNIYDHNASMMLDKKCEVEWIAKVYKEINKEHEEWRASVQRFNGEKWEIVVVVIIQKYIHKWMERCAYLKLLSVTTFHIILLKANTGMKRTLKASTKG